MRLIDADILRKQWVIPGPEPYQTSADEVLATIDEQPTVEAEHIIHGKWELIKTVMPNGERFCSVCCSEQPFFDGYGYFYTDYCPFCGAKMDLN